MFSERHVYIIGPQLLFGDLMAAQIKNHTAANCHVVKQIDEIEPLPTSNRTLENLHLIDCHGQDNRCLEGKIFDEFSVVAHNGIYALFNLEHGLSIEKQALTHGAKGFFYVDDRIETILRGTRLILEGELWASRKAITECLFSLPAQDRVAKKSNLGLTKREVEILSLLAQGDENEAIACSLYISPHTVRTHLHHIFKKLKVKNRLQAAQWATKNL